MDKVRKTTTRRVEPVRITTAPENHHVDLEKRRRRYLVSMVIRSLCFVGAVIAQAGFGITWLMWVLIVGAVFLPYLAVVAANSQAPRIEGTDLPTGVGTHRELG